MNAEHSQELLRMRCSFSRLEFTNIQVICVERSLFFLFRKLISLNVRSRDHESAHSRSLQSVIRL